MSVIHIRTSLLIILTAIMLVIIIPDAVFTESEVKNGYAAKKFSMIPMSTGAPMEMQVDGKYAYVVSDVNGFVIFDLSDLRKPNPIVKIRTGYGGTKGFCVADGIAYYADCGDGLKIIDIHEPENAYVRENIEALLRANVIAISGDYAYVGLSETRDERGSLAIYRVKDLSSSEPLFSIDINGNPNDIKISKGYLYMSSFDLETKKGYLYVLAVDPPEQSYVVQTLVTPGSANSLFIRDDYLFIADDWNGLTIMDISNPFLISIAKTVDTEGTALDVEATSSYAYVADGYEGISIVDIYPIEASCVVQRTGRYDDTSTICIYNDKVFAVDRYSHVNLVHTDLGFSKYTVGNVRAGLSKFQTFANQVIVVDGYAYVAASSNGLEIFDVDPPSSAHLFKKFENPDYANSVFISSGYAYVTSGSKGIFIIDIDPLDSAHLVGNYITAGNARSIAVKDNYAYVAEFENGVEIINIARPESPFSVDKLNHLKSASDVNIIGNYAFIEISQWSSLIQIYDIKEPKQPKLIESIQGSMSGLYPFYSEKYVYIICGYDKFSIMDISSPGSPYEIGHLKVRNTFINLFVSSGFAYLAHSKGFTIVDVSNVRSPSIVTDIDTKGEVSSIVASGGYIYALEKNGWLEIIKWKK